MTPELHREIEECLKLLPADDGGGCPLDKARWMADTIVAEQLACSVEIGVYKGRSFFPQALAQRHIGGLAIGIDPYSKASAREKDLSDDLRKVVDDLIDAWDVGETRLGLGAQLPAPAAGLHARVGPGRLAGLAQALSHWAVRSTPPAAPRRERRAPHGGAAAGAAPGTTPRG